MIAHASYSDMVFRLFKMLGYRFSPHLRDLADQRFWRADMAGEQSGDYGPLNAVARNRVNLSKIETHWPDMLRVAGPLITNQVRAYDLLRMFGREGRLSPLKDKHLNCLAATPSPRPSPLVACAPCADPATRDDDGA